jgi:hypothetical protein
MRELIEGSIAGLIATAPMTWTMRAAEDLVPAHSRGRLPPRQITERVLAKVGVRHELDEDERSAASVVAHYGFGAAAGCLLGLAAASAPSLPRPATGVVVGLAVWAGSYMGWLPASGIRRSAHRDTFISYYTLGEALGFGLDLAIRERTGSARSLDDVMRLLWQRHGRAGGSAGTVANPYDLRDLESALAAVTGDATFGEEFMGRYVRGRETMDYTRLCELAGLVVRRRGAGRGSLGAVGLEQTGSHLALSAPPPPGSPLVEARLGEGDRILALDGRKLDGFDALEQALGRRRPGDRVVLEFARRGEQDRGRTTISLVEDARVELVTAESVGRTPSREQLAFRQAWLFE